MLACGVQILKVHDGIVYEKTIENPFEKFIDIIFEKRKQYK